MSCIKTLNKTIKTRRGICVMLAAITLIGVISDADNMDTSTYMFDPLIKRWIRPKIESFQIEENDLRERWVSDKDFRKQFKSVIVDMTEVAYFNRKESEVTEWGAAILLVVTPPDMILTSVVPHTDHGGRLEGLFQKQDNNELIERFEIVGSQDSSPSFTYYEQYFIENTVDESQPLFRYMCDRDLFRAGDAALNASLHNGALKAGDDTVSKMRQILGKVYSQTALKDNIVEEDGLSELLIADELLNHELWWVRFYVTRLKK